MSNQIDELESERETLMMAHDNLSRELADIKRLIGKDKHELIKANVNHIKRIGKLEKQNKRYREARRRIEERYDKEYDIQANEYMGGIADGLMVAMGIIDKALEGDLSE